MSYVIYYWFTYANSTGIAILDAEWCDVFSSLKDYICVALCDPDACQFSGYILSNYIMFSDLRGVAIQDQSFLGSLKLLYPMDGTGKPETVTI